MNKVFLLEALKDVTEKAVSDLILPTAPQKTDDAPEARAPEVYLMRLPDSSAAKKKVPYIIHQIVTGKDVQPRGQLAEASATVRSVFAVYSGDEQEGGLMLLNLMERVRIELLRHPVIDRRYVLDKQEGLETIIYPDDTSPYFIGEMASVWKLPDVQEEVTAWLR
ncbi:MAG: hypothetical protein LUC98_02040 [Lachnospiraceae bacterium]|nr:hypothetical protein [Oscillospiraceae bacterium]MCD8361737.1 hypothetical protein [Lachnospiraceae bacterium]